MTVQELSKRLQLSPKTILRWIANGELKAQKKRSRGVTQWIISESDVERYIKQFNGEVV